MSTQDNGPRITLLEVLLMIGVEVISILACAMFGLKILHLGEAQIVIPALIGAALPWIVLLLFARIGRTNNSPRKGD